MGMGVYVFLHEWPISYDLKTITFYFFNSKVLLTFSIPLSFSLEANLILLILFKLSKLNIPAESYPLFCKAFNC